MNKQKLELEGMIKKLSDEGKIDIELFEYGDFPIPTVSQYHEKVFIKVLLSKEKIAEAKKTKKRMFVGFHIRPYRIRVDDPVVLQSEPNSPFKNVDSVVKTDYDRSTGNFHKLIGDDEKTEFQVVLVASNGGKERYAPDLPDFDGRIWEEDEAGKNKYLKKEFKEAIDEKGMYFPRLQDAKTYELDELLEQASKAAKINLR